MILQHTRLPKCPPAVPPPRHPPSLPLSSSTEAWQLETPTLPQRPHAARHSAASLSLSCDLPLRFFLPCLLSMFQPHFPFPSSLLHSLTGHLLRASPCPQDRLHAPGHGVQEPPDLVFALLSISLSFTTAWCHQCRSPEFSSLHCKLTLDYTSALP